MTTNGVTDNILEAHCKVVVTRSQGKGIRRKRHGMITLRLFHPYSGNGLLYFPLVIENRSAISYETLSLQCSIRDQQHVRRMAIQEHEMKPVFVYGDVSYIPGSGRQLAVIVLPRLTLPDGQFLRIGFTEKEGGRHVCIDINGHLLEKAKGI